ncbi:MAG: peptidoglycan DD-metalloendopeptidase family protein [Rickettsiales bacterium]|jgi:septal ring factor EnvC (AmiA/AmiB activator)|nr:peptidoglycan DD-metalloendopeptidase family protein [Rickettsiales bacterium]
MIGEGGRPGSIVLILIYFLILFPAFASSDISRIQAQIDAERKKSVELDAAVRASDRDISKTQKELVRAAREMSELESESDALKQKLETLEKRDAELRRTIESGQLRLSETAAALLEIAASPASAGLNAGDALGSSILLSGIADRFDAELRESQDAMKALNETQSEILRQQKSALAAQRKLGSQKTRLDKLLATRGAQNEKLRAQSNASAARLKELAASAKNISDLSDSISAGQAGAGSLGRLKTPVRGMLVRGFGEKSGLGLVSDGWYIRARGGENVVAPDDAFVEFADSFKGRNKVLILSHRNGYYTLLAQMDELSVVAGQSVLMGEPVGRLPGGNPELYMELRSAKRALDPAKFFDKPKGR